MRKRPGTPIIAAIILAILLLGMPALYVSTYLVVVMPKGRFTPGVSFVHYKVAPEHDEPVRAFFWPLEQIDRRFRPGEWNDSP